MSSNISILQKYFNPLYYNIEEPYPGNVVVSSLDNPNNHCLELNIKGNYMKVEYVSKCNDIISGSQIIGIIQKFVKDKGNINAVELQDTSKLPNLCKRYDIPLYIIYILSTGKSWYNSYGYKSANYDTEIRHNKRLLNMNIIDFMIDCNRKSYRPMNEDEFIEMIDGFYNIMYDHRYYKINKQRTKLHPQMTVKETFTRIKKYILKNMPEIIEVGFETNDYCYSLKWLMDLVNHSNIILYDSTTLVWNVPRTFSGRKYSHRINTSRRKSSNDKSVRISGNTTLKRHSI